mgnify:CR=1 FL=1
MGGTDGNERKGIKIGINRCDSGNHDAETYYSTQRTSAERKEVCIRSVSYTHLRAHET